eukprot:66297-Pyramimonas_sp.AAC.1
MAFQGRPDRPVERPWESRAATREPDMQRCEEEAVVRLFVVFTFALCGPRWAPRRSMNDSGWQGGPREG